MDQEPTSTADDETDCCSVSPFTVDLHNYTLSLAARGSEERRTTARGLGLRTHVTFDANYNILFPQQMLLAHANGETLYVLFPQKMSQLIYVRLRYFVALLNPQEVSGTRRLVDIMKTEHETSCSD